MALATLVILMSDTFMCVSIDSQVATNAYTDGFCLLSSADTSNFPVVLCNISPGKSICSNIIQIPWIFVPYLWLLQVFDFHACWQAPLPVIASNWLQCVVMDGTLTYSHLVLQSKRKNKRWSTATHHRHSPAATSLAKPVTKTLE